MQDPGPHGVFYWLDKKAPHVLRYLWKLIQVAWMKPVILKAWHSAGGIFIPKEGDAVEMNQCRPTGLLNVGGKVFYSVAARSLTSYLVKNSLIDTSVQTAGICMLFS